MKFFRKTLISGVMLFLPILIVGLLIQEAVEMMVVIADPLADVLPIDSVGGITVANLLAIILVVVLCFLLGLIARSRTITSLAGQMENSVLNRVPGYVLLKGLVSRLSPDAAAHLIPVLVSSGEVSRIGLEIDRLDDGRHVVYLPGAPNPWSGFVQFVPPEHLERLDIPPSSVLELSERMGHGASNLLRQSQSEERR